MKLRIVVDLDESAQEVHDEHGDVKSILRRPSVVRAIEQAMISTHGKVTMVPLIDHVTIGG